MRTSVDVHNFLIERDVPHEVFLARGRLRSADRIVAVLDLSPTGLGGVVVRQGEAGIEVALAARRRRSGELAWGLPKGLVEPDEEVALTALREIREETGLEARIREPLGDISYWYVWEGARIHKKVTF